MLPKVYIPHEQLRGQRLLIKTCILDKCSTTLPIIYVGVSFRLGSWWMFKQRVIISMRVLFARLACTPRLPSHRAYNGRI